MKFPVPSKSALFRCLKALLTLVVLLSGLHASALLWQHYRTSPWTRDGRVIAETVQVTPEVSGSITRLLVSDNQLVHRGDPLMVIDQKQYQLALASAEANLEARKFDLSLKQEQADRRSKLLQNHAISTEEAQTASNALAVARLAVSVAQAERDRASLDLDRTSIKSPVNGYVTNLHLLEGDYATSGQALFSIIDQDSFWVAAYFEETKLVSVHPGDDAKIRLMSGVDLSGKVESLSSGIADTTRTNSGLANVDPVFNWVRLAQRIPVRVHLDPVPEGVFLASGMTCNVELRNPRAVAKSKFLFPLAITGFLQ